MAGPSRSSRAISDACKLAGTAIAGEGTAAAIRRGCALDAASSTALVISSTNSGMPSVRSMMSCRMLAGSAIVADDVVDHGVDVALRQPIERERGHVRLSDPGRLEFRPEGHDQQHATVRDLITSRPNTSKARRVGPMRILEDHQHRTGAGQALDLRDERVHRSLPALLRGQFECGIAPVVGQRQHLDEERGVLRGGRGLREQRVELVEFRLQRVVVRKVRRRVPFGR